MKKIISLVAYILLAKLAFCQTFTLKSTDLGGQFTNTFVAGNFGCNGDNHSPQLSWSNPPAGTKSFAVTMYDPDAPTGSGFWHWVVVDIPVTIAERKQGAGNIKKTSRRREACKALTIPARPDTRGPCPGEGDAPHRYLITVYALNTQKLGTAVNTPAALSGFLLNKASLGKASLLVYCKR